MTRLALALAGALSAGACACEDVPTLTFAQADATPDAALEASATDALAIETSVEGGCRGPSPPLNPFVCCGPKVCQGCTNQCAQCMTKCPSPHDFCCAKPNNVQCLSLGSTCHNN